MPTKKAANARKPSARPSSRPDDESPLAAPVPSEPSAQPERTSEPARGSEVPAPRKRRWRAPRAEDWERREGVRATLLLHLPTRRERATYRRMGQVLYDASLARSEETNESSAEFAFRQMEAGLSEVRFLEGFFGDVFELHGLDDEQVLARFGRYARMMFRGLSRLADALTRQLDAEANPEEPDQRPDFPASGA